MPSLPKDILDQIGYYENTMVEKYGFKPDQIVKFVPLKLQNLQPLLDSFKAEMAGVHIYLAKATNENDEENYELIIIPCSEDDKGNLVEIVALEGAVAVATTYSVTVGDCKRPPGC